MPIIMTTTMAIPITIYVDVDDGGVTVVGTVVGSTVVVGNTVVVGGTVVVGNTVVVVVGGELSINPTTGSPGTLKVTVHVVALTVNGVIAVHEPFKYV